MCGDKIGIIMAFFLWFFRWRRPFKVIPEKLSAFSRYLSATTTSRMGVRLWAVLCGLFKIVEAFFLVVVRTKIAQLK